MSSMLRLLFTILFAICSYYLYAFTEKGIIQVIFKALPLWILTGLVTVYYSLLYSSRNYKRYNSSYRYNISIGLLLSSLGDIFLEINDNQVFDFGYDVGYFIFGLLSFLVAHIFYILAYRVVIQAGNKILKISKPEFRIVCLIYFGVMMRVLLPNVETALLAPIFIYGAVLSYVAYLSIMLYFINNSIGRYAMYGTLSFVLSDSILAIDKFHVSISNAKHLVMITYYLGQSFIAMSTFCTEVEHNK